MKRRDFARGLGLSAAALSLPRLLGSGRALACPPTPPLRFVVFYEPNGFTHRFARPRVPGMPDWGLSRTTPIPTAASWELGPAFAPLAAYQDRIVSIQGLDMRSAEIEQSTADGGGHGHLQTNALTAAPRIAHNTPGGASIDQHIADGLLRNGVVTPVHSILTSAGLRDASPVYRPDGTSVPVVREPPLLYDRLFPDALAASAEEAARASRRRTSAASHITSLSTGLIGRLGGEHRRRVEAHMALHADLQRRLAVTACGTIPDRAGSLGPWTEPLPWINRPALESLGGTEADGWRLARDINLELTALALGADVSRVAVIVADWLPYDEWGFSNDRFRRSSACDLDPDEGGPMPSMHYDNCPTTNDHDFHHIIDHANHDLGPASDGQTADDAMIVGFQRSMQSLRTFMDRLASLPEGDGTTVLDNTVILVATEMGDLSHRSAALQWLVIGDGHGRIRTGEAGRPLFLDRIRDDGGIQPVENWSHDPASGNDYPYHSSGPSHGDLFATLANTMGVETETFGAEAVAGSPIDLT